MPACQHASTSCSLVRHGRARPHGMQRSASHDHGLRRRFGTRVTAYDAGIKHLESNVAIMASGISAPD